MPPDTRPTHGAGRHAPTASNGSAPTSKPQLPLPAAKVLAAARQQSESRVVEDALRAYLGSGRLEAARSELRELMNRLAALETIT
jgi:hypothetical protein